MTPLARYLANRARRQAHAARVTAKRIHRKRERRGWYRYSE